jgi:hypothetical protein
MVVERPVRLDVTGELQQIIPNTTSAGASDAGKLVALGTDGKLDDSFLHEDVNMVMTSSENISAGALVNVFDSGSGVMKVRNANANTGLPAHGFAAESIPSGTPGGINLSPGIISGLTLSGGSKYFLDPATPGGVVTPAPTYTTGQICQYVGVALSTTELAFVLERIVKIA